MGRPTGLQTPPFTAACAASGNHLSESFPQFQQSLIMSVHGRHSPYTGALLVAGPPEVPFSLGGCLQEGPPRPLDGHSVTQGENALPRGPTLRS